VGADRSPAKSRGDAETLQFRLGGRSYQIASALVREVSGMREVVPCSREGQPVSGLVKIKGRAVPLYDVAEILGSKRSKGTRRARIIVADGRRGAVAFVVDAIEIGIEATAVDAGKALVQADLI
jgi:chemotaxis signal transduction protein